MNSHHLVDFYVAWPSAEIANGGSGRLLPLGRERDYGNRDGMQCVEKVKEYIEKLPMHVAKGFSDSMVGKGNTYVRCIHTLEAVCIETRQVLQKTGIPPNSDQ